jgi:uncharacterized membrane protein
MDWTDNMDQDVKPKRIWRIILVGSLALNLLILGAVGGAYLRGGGAPPRGFDLQLGPLSGALSRQDRREIGNKIRREVGQSGQSRGDRSDAFENLMRAVEAQPFDPETLKRVIEDQQTRQDGIRTAALDVFVLHLQNMPAEDRVAFAIRLRESSAQRNDRNGRRRQPNDADLSR